MSTESQTVIPMISYEDGIAALVDFNRRRTQKQRT